MTARHLRRTMTILAAIDVDQYPGEVLTVGHDLATAYDETMVVVYVMSDDEYEENKTNRGDLPDHVENQYTIDQAKSDAEKRAIQAIEETFGEYDARRVDVRGGVGSPAEEITAITREVEPRLVVVGGRNRSLARQALFGSVSQSVIRNVERPVVTIMED